MSVPDALSFAWPLVWLVLPLPLLVARLLPRAAAGSALRVPFFTLLSDTPGIARPRPGPLLLGIIGWALLVAAASRPQWIGEATQQPYSGRDLLLAVDISGSMRTPDMRVGDDARTRLEAVQRIVGDFIERRRSDRIGLILFGSRPYLHVPLTLDRFTVRQLLDETEIGLAGQETAIGDAIGLAARYLREQDNRQRVLILLTDGASNSGLLEPVRAAELAGQAGLRIHTIGIGAEELLIEGLFGRNRINPSADLDEVAMRRVAERTGGGYFRAHDPAELNEIYTMLDRLEPIEHVDRRLRPVRELYPWPLAAALASSVLLALLLAAPGRQHP
jgi:Ca-activated chloride channel homolog